MSKQIIIVKPEKCVGCNACVRNCPAPEANITKEVSNGKFVTTVNENKCIACGECVKTCSHGARDYIDDTKEAMEQVGKQKMIVIVAPAIKTVLRDKWKSVLNWFKERNCLVFDVSFGADICTWGHIRTIEQNRIGNIISQPCAAIVKYIEIYQPDLIKNLSPIHSPMLCTAIYIRKYLQMSEKIIALSPCVAKKNEFEETRFVNFNVTFKKLMEYFDVNNINIQLDYGNDFRYDFEHLQGQYGGIYPRIGGLRDNLWLHNPTIPITTSEGVHKVYPELDMYAKLPAIEQPPVFDVLSCEHGCNVGAGTGNEKTIFAIMKDMITIEKDAGERRKVSGGWFGRGGTDKLFKDFDKELRLEDFIRGYQAVGSSFVPTRDELEPIYAQMGKHTDADKHYDCNACGYRSCKEMATAIYRGLNTPTNCIMFAKSAIAKEHQKAIKDKEAYKQKLTNFMSKVTDLQTAINDLNLMTNTASDATGEANLSAKTAKKLSEGIATVIESAEASSFTDKAVSQLQQSFSKISTAFEEYGEYISKMSKNSLDTSDKIKSLKENITDIQNELNELIKT